MSVSIVDTTMFTLLDTTSRDVVTIEDTSFPDWACHNGTAVFMTGKPVHPDQNLIGFLGRTVFILTKGCLTKS